MMAYGDWLDKGARVFVNDSGNPHYGDTGYIVERGASGGIVVHLSSDPDHVDRTFSAWDLEDITPYDEGDPEGERLMEIGRQVIDEQLDKHLPEARREGSND